MEVPIIGSDAVQWIQISVSTALSPRHSPCAPPPQDAAGCIAVGGPSDYVIWRIHKDSSTVLEIMEWSFKREPPKFGLHIVFQDSLSPFACISKHQMKNAAGHVYLLYVITTSGFAYLIKLKSPTAYQTGLVLHNNELIQLDISKNLLRLEQITTVAAAAGILCVGGQNGSILCFQLGQVDDSAQDFFFELKDGDAGLGRLWGLVASLNLGSSDVGGRTGNSVLQQKIPLEQGKVIDVKLCSNRLWVLKEGGAGFYDMFHADLESLLQPGIRQRLPLQEALESCKRHLSDSDFRSLTVEGLRKEILTVIESEGNGDNQISLSYEWKNFCSLYLQSWCHNNVPYGLLFDSSTGGIGLIRRHSMSLNRHLDDIEQLIYGMAMVDGDFSHLPAIWQQNIIDCEVLCGILKCTGSISRHLGKTSLALFYEALLKPSSVTFQFLVSRFLRILDTGYDLSVLKQSNSHLGLDSAWGKEHKYHNHHRKFALSILLSLQALRDKADGKNENRAWEGRLGTGDLTLASILVFGYPCTSQDRISLCNGSLQSPDVLLSSVQKFISWILWGENSGKLPNLCSRAIALSSILLQHGQYGVLENLFITIDEHSNQQKLSSSTKSLDDEWRARLHLLGFCLLARARVGLQENLKEGQIGEAIRCFFRAASGEEVSQTLQELCFQTGLQLPGPSTAAAWKLHYFEWVMQILEQHNISAGACQFAHAALEQVDEAVGMIDHRHDDLSVQPAIIIKGRLWANVFKFSVDLEQYRDAYCAIISNPDEESKLICLRRFIIVLCERKATQGRKMLYSWWMNTVRMREEGILKVHLQLSYTLQERLQGLTAAINALHLVDPAYAWVDSHQDTSFVSDHLSPSKRARTFTDENSVVTAGKETRKQYQAVDIQQLENEYVLALAQLQLSLANVKHYSLGGKILPVDLVSLLVQASLYEMAFTVLFQFWRDSSLKRELEKVFQILAQRCCTKSSTSSLFTRDTPTNMLLLPSSAREDQVGVDMLAGNDFQTPPQHTNAKNAWHMLQLYLEKYKKLHPRLPVVAAETLLCTDPQIELPLWLVDMFKGGRRATSWGMAGQESDPAALFRLYIDYGRFSEATYLLLEYIEAWASLRPADIVKRKKMSAVWFPYTSVEHLYGLLSEMRSSGQMIDQCEKLQKLLHGALLGHLKRMKIDSDDAQSSAL